MLLSRVLPKPTSIFRASQPRTLRLPQTVASTTLTPTFRRNPLFQTFIMSIHMKGRCVCKNLQYSLELESLDDARTTLCHCNSCKRAFGTNYGLTTKVPLQGFKYETGTPKKFKQHNGVTREFCDNCGAYICEYGQEAADKFRYIMWGSFDEPEKVPPKGEFFCKNKPKWMPDIPDTFRKQEIKE
ncbi:Mss4-like protein [Pseudoneurospora amorphoporcata]|uniref:Mss4-like protein n=1 Tax=Pseudoneurospora amorphoporcata TaxID=241081 RepID=A0AAN6SFJ8_9PEZI|nr:Mss4-like protein [Pseudoneurospora amorphoporcata]